MVRWHLEHDPRELGLRAERWFYCRCVLLFSTHYRYSLTPVIVWISPVSQNYEGPRSAYGDAYHGYWISDASKLNDRFGTADDLKALSDEIHRRGM